MMSGTEPPTGELAGIAVGPGRPVRLMAVLNVSPESFYRGSVQVADRAALRDTAQRAVDEGADFIDVGAMSTAPYLDTAIDEEEEARRMEWAVAAVAAAVDVPISADTSRAHVARVALDCGARVLNDVRGLALDPDIAEVAARADGVVAVAHPGGARGEDPVLRVRRDLRAVVARARRAGVEDRKMAVDPAFGFYSRDVDSPAHFSTVLLARLGELQDLGFPILIGLSRKSFVGALSGREDPAERLAGSLGATAAAVLEGVSIVRTHDVAATRDAVRVAQAIRAERRSCAS